MSQLGTLKHAYLSYFSQPATDRVIYRLIDKHPVRSILELGVGDAVRAERMISLASRQQADVELRYIGIDLFEDRPAGAPQIALKQAYLQLRQQNVKVRLVPGDPLEALTRIANEITGIDLVVVAGDQEPASMARAWMFLPRMVHGETIFLAQAVDPQGRLGDFAPLTRQQVDELACQGGRRRRLAA
ncbi:MAG: hypothetical protein GX575_00020 [Candidatus Anammoximicrobium sp.]|nr:hypothetical protein [Candidatus Anammoximicrobium sp.]